MHWGGHVRTNLTPEEYTLENIGLTLSVLGLTLLNINYKEEE